MTLKRFFVGMLMGISATTPLAALADTDSTATKEQKIHQFTLNNGLKVLVKEDHRAPVVVSQIWYKIGSSYEHKGITGVSHVLEHMMFKGTKAYASGEFSEIVAYNGGKENAFTSKDYTAYFQRIGNDKLDLCLKLEADRMVNLSMHQEDFAKEVEVVKEERRMRTEDKPRSKLFEQFNAQAFMTSPYRNPTIGWMEDLDDLTVDDVKRWYRLWYSPNNATLVIVGDVDHFKVFDLVRKHFALIPAASLPKMKKNSGLQQLGKRQLELKLPAKLPYLMKGYKTPTLKTAQNKQDVYALEVLAGILDGGNSARLPSQLVRGQQVAASAGASYSLADRLDGLFLFDGIPADGFSVDDLEKALDEQIEQMKKGKIEEAELDRVKAGVLASKIYEQDSMFYQAMQIGIAETVGLGYQILDEYAQQIQKVSVADVQRVARQYFVEDHETRAELNPLPIH